MEYQDIWQQFTTLPPDAQALVADFIAILKQRYNQPQSSEQLKQTNWQSDPFIGIWQDCKGIQNSTQWVRSTRSLEWRSQYHK